MAIPAVQYQVGKEAVRSESPHGKRTLSALDSVTTPPLIVHIGHWLFLLLLASTILALLAPWQQNVLGWGQVSAFTPIEREQTIQAPVAGRIAKWHVQEGSKVKTGDVLIEIADLDPDLVVRLREQKAAFEAKVEALEEQVKSYNAQTQSLIATRDLLVTTAQYRLKTALERTRSAEEALAATEATLIAAQAQQTRLKRLLAEGIVSRRDFELSLRDEAIALRSVNSAKASLNAALADQRGAKAEIDRVRADAQSKVDSGSATANKASSDLADSRTSLAKIRIDLARQHAQTVNAPRDGTVFRLFGNPVGAIVKQSDPLLVLVPNTSARAVELWVSGNDAPLITPGRHARLQFEGWPAVQFVGWPSVAVGTFGGTVAFVDSTDDGKGRFRIMVVPDEGDHAWPPPRFLRQGVRAKGWVLLNEVRLGYELWRQLNGFPPVVSLQEPKESEPKTDIARKRLK
jgi:multidrug efflux pump subunit AcrA (membrane-fusion protein)